MQAAVVADAMVVSQPAIRLEDLVFADFSLAGPVATELLQNLRHLLYDGGRFSGGGGRHTGACMSTVPTP